jgi:hypothetical protein
VASRLHFQRPIVNPSPTVRTIKRRMGKTPYSPRKASWT